MKRRRIVGFLLALFMCFALVPVGNASAEPGDPIDQIVAEIEYYYLFADDFNESELQKAQGKLGNLTEVQLDEIALPLVTGKVIAKYEDTDLYDKNEWNEFIVGFMAFSYLTDTNSVQLKEDLESFRQRFSPHFKVLFEEEITMDDLARLLSNTRDQIRPVIGLAGAGTLANDGNSVMIEKMTGYLYDALDAAAALSGNEMFEDKFSELGWNKELLVQQTKILAGYIDPNGDARRSLALMAIRSETDAIDDQNVTVGDTLAYTVKIMGEDASALVGWHSTDNDVVAVTLTEQGFDIKAVGRGTAELLAYRDYSHSEPLKDWLVRFNVTVAGAGVTSSGGGGGGVVTPTVTGVEIKAAPDKVIYNEGDKLDLTGLKVTLTYSNGTTKDISLADFADNKITVTPGAGDVLDADDQEIVITVNGKTVKQAITVKGDTTVTPPVVDEPVLGDIDGHWAENSIDYLVEMGAISGYPDGTFKPDALITRAEFAKVIVDAFKLTAESGKVFTDTANHWAKDYVAIAAANGIVLGYNDNEFGPDDLITREQMAIIIVKAAGLTEATGELSFSDTAEVSSWAYDWVVSATQNGIMSGYEDNTFKPLNNATRAEAATVIYNVLMK